MDTNGADPPASGSGAAPAFDVVIVGGGPAGLSAALVLGRCRRRVLVCDSGRPRNWASKSLNAFPTRDGVDPAEFRRLAREELARYPSVHLRDVEVRAVRRAEDGFAVEFADGAWWQTPVLLLATGQIDILPPVEGAAQHYGRGVFHCPICDGWERRDEPWAVYGRGAKMVDYALELLSWTSDLVLCTDGPAVLDDAKRARLERNGVEIIAEPLVSIHGDGERLEKLVFASGRVLPRRALFFYSEQAQRSEFPAQFGVRFDAAGAVICDPQGGVGVPGLYVAGNVRRGMQLSIFAAAEGAQTACEINSYLNARSLR